MKNLSVLVVYHYFPHYRLPILKKLTQDPDITYRFVSGSETDTPIEIVDQKSAVENKLNWVAVKNIWLANKKILWQSGLLTICARREYDCIIFLASPYFLSTWIGILIARLRKKKVLLWGHFTLRNSRKDFFKTFFYRLADGLLLYGRKAKEDLTKRGFNPDKLFVIYNSLNYDLQVSYRNSLSQDMADSLKRKLFKFPEFPVLLFTGRLTKQKKLEQLIEAAFKLRSNGQPVNVLLIGDGEEKKALMECVNHLGINEFVNFYGETYDESELAQLISLADICVSPGNVGLTAMHALAYGTPVITHDNPYEQGPEYEAIISGVTGKLFEQDSIDSLTKVISEWLGAKSGIRETVRTNCYQVIDQYYNPDYQSKMIKSALSFVMDTGR